MKIRKVTIQNLNSLRLKVCIDFNAPPLSNVGLFAITGDTGAGKTTVLDAITLALYGRVHRNKDVKEVMSFGAAESLAEVEFETGTEVYRSKWSIWRARRKEDGQILGPERELSRLNPQTGEFEILAQKKGDSNQLIEQITGLDYDRFSRSVLLSQGDFAAFLRAGERERSELLERITGTEVYSILSKAAYQKARLEEEQLRQLRIELEALRIMDASEITELEAEQQQLKQTARQLKSVLEQTAAALQWRRQLVALVQKGAQLEAEQQVFKAAQNAATPDMQRLELHRRAAILEPSLLPLDEAIEHAEALQSDVSKLAHSIPQKEADIAEAIQKSEDAKTHWENLSRLFREREPLFDQAMELDVRIQQLLDPMQRIEREYAGVLETQNTGQRSLEACEAELRQITQDTGEWEKWLAAHTADENLPEHLPLIEAKLHELRGIYSERKQAADIATASAAALEDLRVHAAQMEERDAAITGRLEQLRVHFKSITPEQFATTRAELLQLANVEIERLQERRKNLEQLNRLHDGYQNLLRELSTFEEQLENLQREELDINKQMMTLLDALDIAQKQLEFKQDVYEQQQLIANYEKDRQLLQEGEPCPLCFATVHPFRERQFKPHVNQAKQELDNAKQQYEFLRDHYRKLMRRQADIAARIEHLAGAEMHELSGQIASNFERIMAYEQQIAGIAPLMASEDFHIAPGITLASRLAEAEHDIETKKKTRADLIERSNELDSLEAEWQQFAQLLAEKRRELLVQQEKLNAALERKDFADRRFVEMCAELNQLMAPYGYQFEENRTKSDMESLRNRSQVWKETTQNLREARNRVALLEQQTQQTRIKLADTAQRLHKLEEERSIRTQEMETLQNRRAALSVSEDPKAQREQERQELALAEQVFHESRANLQTLQAELASIQGLLAQRQADAQEALAKVETRTSALEVAARKAGFEDISKLRAALLSPAEAASIEQHKADLERKILESDIAIQSNAESLKLESEKNLSQESSETLEKTLVELQAQNETLQQRLGAIQAALEQDRQRRLEASERSAQLERQAIENRRWAKLNDIIGSADGKKFRVFAQGLTLRKLVALANEHLQRLSGRYIIHRRSDEDLELEIMDTFQADNRRSVNTLSGGESFLVSLALALGLSDLAGRNAAIHSLFIDEGFGTLDDNSLDLAVSTLENLQASGKTIGIISHVKELKERIGAQIFVRKSGNGVSTLEVIG